MKLKLLIILLLVIVTSCNKPYRRIKEYPKMDMNIPESSSVQECYELIKSEFINSQNNMTEFSTAYNLTINGRLFHIKRTITEIKQIKK